MTAPTVEVFADVTCAFTHVGLRAFAARRATEGRDDVLLRVRAWPLELVNGEGMDPAKVATQVAALREQVTPELFAEFDPSRFPTTSLPAFALVARAYESGLATGERASFAVRDALFERGLDVADAAVLQAIADDLGIDGSIAYDDWARDAVGRDHEEGTARGVEGSPEYFVDGRRFFCPALVITRPDGALVVGRDTERFEEFLNSCFAAEPSARRG
jgi:predicted DsbA family dithiol-disulfide isomerase